MSEGQSSGTRYTFKKRNGAEETPFPTGARTTRDEEGKRTVQTFDSLQDALEASTFSTKANKQLWAEVQTGDYGRACGGGARWYGLDTNDVGDALPLNVRTATRHGWPEGVARMREALDGIGATLQPRNVRRVRRWADFGDSVEMSRVWAGRVDVAWQRCERQQRPAAQNVTIAANITALAGVDARALFWRGAAVLKLADLLTTAGYNVRIDAIRQSRNAYEDGAAILQRVTVKEATAPLELNSLAATLCLSGFFRVVFFQCQCLGPGTARQSFGKSETYTSTTGEICGVEACMSAEAARRWVEHSIAKIEGGPEQLAA